MKILVAAAAAALCATLGRSAFAAEETPAPSLTHDSALTCRIATGYETQPERALGFDTLLVCKPAGSIGVLKPNGAGVPQQRSIDEAFDGSRALSPMQMTDAWKAYVDRTFSIDHSP